MGPLGDRGGAEAGRCPASRCGEGIPPDAVDGSRDLPRWGLLGLGDGMVVVGLTAHGHVASPLRR